MADTYTLAEATMKVIQDRRSIREWTDEPVSEEDLDDDPGSGPAGAFGRKCAAVAFHRRQGSRDCARKLGALAGGGSGRRFTAEFVTKQMQERFASLQDEAKKKAAFEKLTSGQVSAFLADAPVNIVVCGKKEVWDTPYDTSAAIENILLMVTALGLGACWVIAPCIDIRDEERHQGPAWHPGRIQGHQHHLRRATRPGRTARAPACP